ncbi:MAG: hypothetical protein H6631_06010 [Anaerolineaceae bacterium]|nr:hypothetical protein [Anaerolineaceae bacterium]MCB9101351.1 hypothetical protein [Anaerolineales bacterium]
MRCRSAREAILLAGYAAGALDQIAGQPAVEVERRQKRGLARLAGCGQPDRSDRHVCSQSRCGGRR